MGATVRYAPIIGYVSAATPETEFRLIDIGCSGGIDPIWREMGPRLRALAIDPNIVEIERLRRAETHAGIEYLAASAGLAADHPFAVRHPGRSHWTRNPWDRLSVVRSIEQAKSAGQTLPPELGAATLDSDAQTSERVVIVPDYLRNQGAQSVDFIKIDIDGADFDVLNSFDAALSDLGVLGVSIEVSYFGADVEADRGFHNVDRFMKGQGFELFDATIRRYSLAALPSRYLWGVPAESEFGRPMFGDALYLRDLGSLEHGAFAARMPPAKLLNLMCLFAAYNLPDCAADLALRFRDRVDASCSVERLLDLLASQAQGPVAAPLTYSEYLRRFSSGDRAFFGAAMQGQAPADPAAASGP